MKSSIQNNICLTVRFIVILNFLSCCLSAQTEKIKIKKENDQIVFFQKGEKRDTISKNKSDLFYILIPDSLKKNLTISVENGNFIKTKNDSLFTLIHIPGIKYECVFIEHIIESGTRPHKKGLGQKCLINGISSEVSGTIRIVFKLRDQLKPLMEGSFIYGK